jgi:hypothetical protein
VAVIRVIKGNYCLLLERKGAGKTLRIWSDSRDGLMRDAQGWLVRLGWKPLTQAEAYEIQWGERG